MSLILRTNRWASKAIIILQLVTWNAVGIILLQKGVSTLRRNIQETSHIMETNSSIDLGIESAVFMRHVGNEYDFAMVRDQRQLTDKNAKVISTINEEQLSRLSLSNPLEIDRGSSRVGNHVTEIKRHIDYPENTTTWSKILRITRDRKRVLDNTISRNTHIEDIVRPSSVSKSISEEEENRNVKGKDLDFVKNIPSSTAPEPTSSIREKIDAEITDTFQKSKNKIKFSRINDSGAATAVIMIAIGIIMLFVGPALLILRILDEGRQARKLLALSATMREDSPPTYEQAVFMSEAPRYSTLALNEDRSSSPSPPPSPTFSNYVIKSHST